MNSLLLRNLLFTILQPGIVAGLVPYFLVKDRWKEVFSQSFQFYQAIGIMIFLAGLGILFHTVYLFATHGKGTLSPADPTKKLVTRGLYKYSRNPMYFGVIFMLLGETIFLRSLLLGGYMFLVITFFLIFIIFFEEHRLRKDFGEEYMDYRSKVKRWF